MQVYAFRTSAWARVVVTLALGLGFIGATTAPTGATGSTGVIEICKTASGAGVSGSFDFTVSGITDKTYSVPVGQCSNPITVTAGQVTITEKAREGFQLAGVTVQPTTAGVSTNLAAQTETINVAAGDVAHQTIVTFSNKAVDHGYLEVCKKAATGTTLSGTFTFTVSAGGTNQTVSAPVGGCSAPLTLPAGNATITENQRSDAQLTAIDVAPASRIVGSANLTTRSVTVSIVAGSLATQTVVTFTNQPTPPPPPPPPPPGTVKVCKSAANVPAGSSFDFTVNGATVTVQAGSCSLPISAAPGTAVVAEKASTGYVVTDIGVEPAAALVSRDLGTRTVSVTVTSDQVTEVTFTNKPATGTLKICKAAGTGVVAGQIFDFTVAGQTVHVQAGYCSLPLTFPVGSLTIGEHLIAGYLISNIGVAGAGSLISSNPGAGTAVVSIGEGVTEVTFTNAHQQQVSGCTLTKGYYKNHPGVVANLLTATGGKLLVGGTQLTPAQIDALYDRTSTNYINQVTQQLITALLNQLRGASTPTDVQTAIAAASLLIEQHGGPLTGTVTSQTTVTYNGVTYTASQLVKILSAYNEGSAPGGPSHC